MLTIYGVPISVHTRKVIVTAFEKQLEFRNEPVVPFNPPANWGELSPTGKIPIATDGDLVLRDSSVICAYLERVHPAPRLYPEDNATYARALFFEEYADGTLFTQVVHPLFFQKIIRPHLLGQGSDTVVIDQVVNEVWPKVLGYVERELDGDFIAGNTLSIADIAITSNLMNLHYLGMRIGSLPRLQRYFRRMLARASFQQALAAEQDAARSMQLDMTLAA